MKVLLIAGTGAMGKHLTQILVSKGVNVVVTSRTKKKPQKGVKYIQGNAKDLAFLKPLLEIKWDTIVDFMVYKTEEFRSIIDLLLSATKQYIFLSSARVYSNSNTPLKENSQLLIDSTDDATYIATDEYALAKARQEYALIDAASDNWTIIRPYITYSEDRIQLGVLEKEDWLYRALKGRSIIFTKDIASKISTLTYGLDVACGIKAIIGDKESLTKIFHITNNQSMKWQNILDIYISIIEKNTGYKAKIFYTSLDQFLEITPYSKYQIYYDRLYNRKFDNSAIALKVDVNSFRDTEEQLKLCLNKFIKEPNFLSINWKREALKDRLCKEYTPLREIKGYRQKVKYLVYRYNIKKIKN